MAVPYSYEVLEQTPERVTQFLLAIGAVPEIRTCLAIAGMNDDEIITGRNLLLDCLAAPQAERKDMDTPQAKSQRQSQAELDQLDEEIFARTSAALTRFYPSAREYVFKDLKASRGAAAVKSMATFLARLDALEKGSDPNRKATSQEDTAAIKLLTRRGIGPEQRQYWKKLVETALGPTPALTTTPAEAENEARWKKLASLKAWYDDWTTTARSVIRKRNYLIRLGLAQRRYATEKTAEATEIAAPADIP